MARSLHSQGSPRPARYKAAARPWRRSIRSAVRDWSNRIGKVMKYSRDRSFAYVIWNGNRGFDRVSVGLLKPAARGN
jgi:hypothetical protein